LKSLKDLAKLPTNSQAFILMAAIIYSIAIIFSKGAEHQEDSEETL
jgi:hypothetical protein